MSDKELLRKNLQPIFLGNSKKARDMARRLYQKYGIISYICDTRRSLSCLFSLSFAFWRVSPPNFDELLCEQLRRIASFDEECIYIALPADEGYRKFVSYNREKLSAFLALGEPENPFCDIPIAKSERR